jgi:beta-lactamase regulating signal transducer with metallopeptidase domain
MMFELALRSTVILAAAWLLARAMPRASAATRHLVWHVATVAVLAAPILIPVTPAFPVPMTQWLSDAAQSVAPAMARPADPLLANAVISSETTRDSTRIAATSTRATTSGGFQTVRAIWIGGSVLVLAWFAVGWVATMLITRRATIAPIAWQLELQALCARMRIKRDVRLRICGPDRSPITTGSIHPLIMLPSSALFWTEDRRRAVMLHELAHIQRGDCRVQSLARAACVLYWFNPLVWVAAAGLRRERERACDDEVLRYGAQPSVYAAHLLDIARSLRRSFEPSTALAMARPSDLEGRLLCVLAEGRARRPAPLTRWAVSASLSITTIASLGASPHSPTQATSDVRSTGTSRRLALDEPTMAERAEAQRHVQRAANALRSPDVGTRERATLDLVESGEASTLEPLALALSDESADVREKAALGLGLLSNPNVVPALLRALNDRDPQVREKAAIGLALRRDERIIEPLIAAMNDPDSQVREKVVIALGTSGSPRALPSLERALQDPDAQVREKATTALILLGTSSPDGTQGERVREGVRTVVGGLLGLLQ